MSNIARPFIKWVGGKSKLLSEIRKYYPQKTKYAEPFVGGGAVLFDVLQKNKKAFICDSNYRLIDTYRRIQDDVQNVIAELEEMQEEYLRLDVSGRNEYYLKKREQFNKECSGGALMIFLNKTCFNGLYRVNKKNEFNVSHGRYTNPKICDKENLLAVSKILRDVIIECGDYKKSKVFIDENTFVYFDPPYVPVSKTSFTAYTKDGFGQEEQKELVEFAREMKGRGASILISNSAPEDGFLNELYKDFHIEQVLAGRPINSNGAGRGKVKELLVS